MVIRSYILGVLFLSPWRFLTLALSPKDSAWKEVFTFDVAVQGYNKSTVGETPFECSRSCARWVSCLAFGFSQESKTCWLYDHLVLYYNMSGTAALGTRYFWRLSQQCPIERGYTLKAAMCYRVTPSNMTWEQGRELCSQEGAHLFVGDARKKTSVLLTMGAYLWMGASDLHKEGDWKWVDGTSLPRTFPLWKQGEPNNKDGKEDWLELRGNGVVNDESTLVLRRAACQIPLV